MMDNYEEARENFIKRCCNILAYFLRPTGNKIPGRLTIIFLCIVLSSSLW